MNSILATKACGRWLTWSCHLVRHTPRSVKLSIPRNAAARTAATSAATVSAPLMLESTAAHFDRPHLETPTLLMVDGSAELFRVWSTKRPEPEDTLPLLAHLFTAELLNLVKARPSHLAVVFDAEGMTFRHVQYPDYKSQREPWPPELRHAHAVISHAVQLLGCPVLCVPGVEAEDVIATMAKRAIAEQDLDVVIVSHDKDFFQLLQPKLCLWRNSTFGFKVDDDGRTKKGYTTRGRWTAIATYDAVKAEYGVEPGLLPDLWALSGHKNANIPGVPSLGEKRALELLKMHGTLEGVLQNAAQAPGPKLRQALEEARDSGKEVLQHSRKLLTLISDLKYPPVSQPLSSFQLFRPADGGQAFLEELEKLNVPYPIVEDWQETLATLPSNPQPPSAPKRPASAGGWAGGYRVDAPASTTPRMHQQAPAAMAPTRMAAATGVLGTAAVAAAGGTGSGRGRSMQQAPSRQVPSAPVGTAPGAGRPVSQAAPPSRQSAASAQAASMPSAQQLAAKTQVERPSMSPSPQAFPVDPARTAMSPAGRPLTSPLRQALPADPATAARTGAGPSSQAAGRMPGTPSAEKPRPRQLWWQAAASPATAPAQTSSQATATRPPSRLSRAADTPSTATAPVAGSGQSSGGVPVSRSRQPPPAAGPIPTAPGPTAPPTAPGPSAPGSAQWNASMRSLMYSGGRPAGRGRGGPAQQQSAGSGLQRYSTTPYPRNSPPQP